MKQSVFIDTGYWIALFDRRDTNHSLAASSLKPLLKNYYLYLSDFIVFESLTYLKCSINRHDLAVSFLDKIDASRLTILPVDEFVKTQAVDLFRKYSDKALSTDLVTRGDFTPGFLDTFLFEGRISDFNLE